MSLRINQIESLTAPLSDAVVFGGTFDPVHEGHIDVIRQVLPLAKHLIIAPTSQNPWKAATTPLALRLEMLRLVLSAEQLSLTQLEERVGISLYEQGYVYAIDLVNALRNLGYAELHWLVGEDIAEEVKRWKDFTSANVPVLVARVRLPVHATEVRAKQADMHPAIRDFARLYGDSSFCP